MSELSLAAADETKLLQLIAWNFDFVTRSDNTWDEVAKKVGRLDISIRKQAIIRDGSAENLGRTIQKPGTKGIGYSLGILCLFFAYSLGIHWVYENASLVIRGAGYQ